MTATREQTGSRARIRRLSRIALFAAVAVAGGYLLVAVPNVELVSATVALSGWLLGSMAGVLTGILAEAIFGALNPYGFPYPPVWLSQMLGMAFTGFFFGRIRRILATEHIRAKILICLFSGILVTFVFDLLTNVTFPLAMGVPLKGWWPYLLAGIPFCLIHVTSNALIFSLVLPPAHARLARLMGVTDAIREGRR